MTPDLNGADALLMIGSSERCANLFYATRFPRPRLLRLSVDSQRKNHARQQPRDRPRARPS